MFSQSNFVTGFAVACLLATPSIFAQNAPPAVTQKAGHYAVDLRLPAEGLYASEETDLEFHVSDTQQDDPVQGAPPVVNATVTAHLTMPAMRSMALQKPKTHREGVPGDYGAVFYFPHGGDYQIDLTVTPPNEKAFVVTFKVAVNDAEAGVNRKPQIPPYSLEIQSVPAPEAGMPTELTIVIRSRDTKQPVTEFDTVHERTIHFMVVSADLVHFSHEHPTANKDGKFTLTYTFPTGGLYHLFADVAPKGAGSLILRQGLRVGGPVPPTRDPAHLPDALISVVGGVKFALTSRPADFPVGKTLPLTFSVQKVADNGPVTDLQPYLGAMAHLMLIRQDGATFVHCHPDEADANNGKNGTLKFLARFPKPGLYRGWLQFERDGQVQTASFTWRVTGDGAK